MTEPDESTFCSHSFLSLYLLTSRQFIDPFCFIFSFCVTLKTDLHDNPNYDSISKCIQKKDHSTVRTLKSAIRSLAKSTAWPITSGHTPGRNHLNVISVTNDLRLRAIWKCTAGFIPERNRTMNVHCVINGSHLKVAWTLTWSAVRYLGNRNESLWE